MSCRVSIVLGTSKTIKLYEVPNKVPKRFGFNEFSSDFAGQIEGTKKPAGLVPCGLSGFHRTYPDHCVVELAGVEPASEITTPSALHA